MDMSISLFIVGIFSLCLFFSSVFVSMAYAQIFPRTHIPTSTNTTNFTSSSSHSASQQQQKPTQHIVLHLVKIVTRGLQIPVGDNLMISGISADNTTSDICDQILS